MTALIDLENIMLHGISQSDKEKYHLHVDYNEPKQSRKRHRYTEQTQLLEVRNIEVVGKKLKRLSKK